MPTLNFKPLLLSAKAHFATATRMGRGIYAASVCQLSEAFGVRQALDLSTLKRRKRRAPVGVLQCAFCVVLLVGVVGAPLVVRAADQSMPDSVSPVTTNAALRQILEDSNKLLALALSARGGQGGASSVTGHAATQSAAPATSAPVAPVQPKPRRLEEAEVRDLLVEALKHQRDETDATWELTFTRPWNPVTVPDAPVVAEILEPAPDRMTSTPIFRFQLRSGNTTLGSWQVPARARLLRDVVVARATLQRGQGLSSADVVSEPRDVLSLRQPVLQMPADPGAYELTEMVQAGAPLTARSLRLKPVVVRGQLADATVRQGAMVISLKVEVLEEGVPGQVVRVRNPQSRRELRGKVEDEKTIDITL